MIKETGHMRELAGIAVAVAITFAFILIGFLQMGAQMFGMSITAPGDWGAAMLSLCSAAVGYLIGKQSSTPAASAISGMQIDPQNPMVVQRTQQDTMTVTPTPAATVVTTTDTTTDMTPKAPEVKT